MKPRIVVIIAALGLHPLLVLGNLDWTGLLGVNAFTQQSGLLAAAIEVVLLAGLAQRLGWRPSSPSSDVPAGVELTPSGFHLELRGPVPSVAYAVNAALGTLASSVGFTMLMMAVAQFGLTDFGPIAPGVFVLVMAGSQVVLQALAMIVVARARYQNQAPVSIELRGRVLRADGHTLALEGNDAFERSKEQLRVSDGGSSLVLRAPEATLTWIEHHLRSVGDGGSRAEVPDTLHAVSRQADTSL